MNFFDHKDLGNHLLQLCPKVMKHPISIDNEVGLQKHKKHFYHVVCSVPKCVISVNFSFIKMFLSEFFFHKNVPLLYAHAVLSFYFHLIHVTLSFEDEIFHL